MGQISGKLKTTGPHAAQKMLNVGFFILEGAGYLTTGFFAI
jgi:hypothetical protein